MTGTTSKIAQSTRFYRKIHKWISIPLFLFLFLIGVTGLLLGWKKQVNLLPSTAKGTSNKSEKWLSIDSLQRAAIQYSTDTLNLPSGIDRLDIRPAKGIVKVVFAQHFTELQLDCTTGTVLSVKRRHSDIIEKIHDGSILDYWFQNSSDAIKLFYTTAASLGLIFLSFSGFWLWYNPIRIKNVKHKEGK
jgi:uncharacterized iron-regulated membrane protein